MQFVTWTRKALLATVAAMLASGAVVATTGAAAAAAGDATVVAAESSTSTAAGDLQITNGALVLSYVDGRYTGQLPVKIRYTGSAPVRYTGVQFQIPAGLRLVRTNDYDIGACIGPQSDMYCLGPAFEPGQVRRYSLTFESWAAPQTRARITGTGTITVVPKEIGNPDPAGATAADTFRGLLKGSTGSLRHPTRYTPSTSYDFTISSGATSVQSNPDGTLLVTVPLTVRNTTDAPNTDAWVAFTLPSGVISWQLDPSAVCTSGCAVPGDAVMVSGEERTFQLLLTLAAGTLPGTYAGTVSVTVSAEAGPVVDATPADNTTAFEYVVSQ